MSTSRATKALVPLDMVSACRALGLEKIREEQSEVWALCPGHEENVGRKDSKNNNFSVNKESGKYHCFSCGFGGDYFASLVVYIRGCDGWEANRWIRKNGISLAALDALTVEELEPEERESLERGERLKMTESRLTVFTTPPAKEMRRRNLTPEAVEHHGVLWDDDKKAWILPIRTEEGVLIGWQIKGRDVFRNYPVGVKKQECLFGLDVFSKGTRAIVVESPLDVVRLTSEGISGGLATFGSEFSDHQMRLILERTDEVCWAGDNDDGGRQAAKRAKRDWARRFYFEFFSYDHTDAKDIGEMDYRDILTGLNQARHSTAVVL